jgi:hypothetical protein
VKFDASTDEPIAFELRQVDDDPDSSDDENGGQDRYYDRYAERPPKKEYYKPLMDMPPLDIN